MAKVLLPTNFLDDELNASMHGTRQYKITRADGSSEIVTIEDISEYNIVGNEFGAEQINQTNMAVNASADSGKIIDSLATIRATTQGGYMAGALAVKELDSRTNSNIQNLAGQIEQIKYNLSVIVESPLQYVNNFSDADANWKSIIYTIGKIMLITINCKCQTIITQQVILGRIDRNCTGNTVFTPAGRHGRVELSYNNGWVLTYDPMGTPLQPGTWIQGFIIALLR